MNAALFQAGYVITIIPPIMRHQYFAAIRQANGGDEQPFIEFIADMAYESHREYVRLLE